jgi:hypothetical protein
MYPISPIPAAHSAPMRIAAEKLEYFALAISQLDRSGHLIARMHFVFSISTAPKELLGSFLK